MENIKYIVTLLLGLLGVFSPTTEVDIDFPKEIPTLMTIPVVEEIDEEEWAEIERLVKQYFEVREKANELLGMKGDCYWIASKFCESYYGIKLKEGILTEVSYDDALPGDIVHYKDNGCGNKHWAVYLGQDEALHGNFNGKTILYSVFLKNGSYPKFYRFSTEK